MNSLKIKSPFYCFGHFEKEERERKGGKKEGRLHGVKWPKYQTEKNRYHRVSPNCCISNPVELLLGKIVKPEKVRLCPAFLQIFPTDGLPSVVLSVLLFPGQLGL